MWGAPAAPALPSSRLRLLGALALTLLLLSGCLGEREQPRLAQPTDKPIVVPVGKPTPTPVAVDFEDPGYTMDGAWRVGDGWDYESNQSRAIRMRVVDAVVRGGASVYLLETTRFDAQGRVEGQTRAWVDGRTWSRVNLTDDKGNVDRFFPGAPMRLFKNATATFNHTRVDAQGKLLANESVRFSSYLHPRHETIQAKFGEYYETRKVEQVSSATALDGSGARSRTLVTHWVHRNVLNDVAFQLETGERYTLAAFKAGDTRRGTLAG